MPREIGVDADVLVERERGVDAVAVVRPDAPGVADAMREHPADAAAPQDVALGAKHREVRRLLERGRLVVAGLHVEHAERDAGDLAGEPSAGAQRHLAPAVEADAAAEEQIRRVAAAGREPGAGAAGEREDAEALEKEVALLGEEQVEARQVDLLLVDFDLREVGVDGQVRGQVLRQRRTSRRRRPARRRRSAGAASPCCRS